MKKSYYEHELPDGYSLELRLLIEALGWAEGFYRGEALTHLVRAGLKPDTPAVEDIIKAETYLGFERDRLARQAMATIAEADGEPECLWADSVTTARGLEPPTPEQLEAWNRYQAARAARG